MNFKYFHWYTSELFGDALSDSDVDDGDQATEIDFESRLSMDDAEDESSRLSRISDSTSFAAPVS